MKIDEAIRTKEYFKGEKIHSEWMKTEKKRITNHTR